MRGTTFRRAAALAAFALALIAMAACGGAARPAPTATAPAAPPAITAAADEPLIIGVSVAMSGDQAATGGDIADAVNLAVADAGGALRGHPIKVIVSDDGCTDAEKARSIAREFATDAALLGVIGPMCTTGAQAANSVYEAAGIVHISPSATRVDLSEQGEQYFFRVGWRDDAQASWQARFAWNTLRIESVALVDDAEPYGRGLADAFAKAFEGLGGRIVARERVERGTTDMTDLARKVSSAAPGAVVFEGLNPEGALVAKALRTEQFTGVFIGPDGLLNARDFLGAGGAAVEGAIVSGDQRRTMRSSRASRRLRSARRRRHSCCRRTMPRRSSCGRLTRRPPPPAGRSQSTARRWPSVCARRRSRG